MSELSLVSVIAVCYNHAKYVIETLDSIKDQTYPNIELIIMDDSSKDNSVEVIQEWIDKNKYQCQFIAHKENQGLCKTLNEALKECTGKYFQLTACDDLLLPFKLSNQVDEIQNLDQDYGLVYSDVGIMNDNSSGLKLTFYQESKYIPKSGDLYFEQARRQFIKFVSCLCVTDYIKKIGGFDENLTFEDVDFFLRFAKEYKFKYINEVTCFWRKHESNMTNSLYTNTRYLESRLLAYNKHVGFKNKLDDILKPKIIKLIKLLYKQSIYVNTNFNFLNSNKSSRLLIFFYSNKLPFRIFYFVEITLNYIKNLKMCLGDISNLPPKKF